MPTGHTKRIYDGQISFREFIEDISEGFGFGRRGSIYETSVPDEYYAKKVAEAEARISELEGMDAEAIVAESEAANQMSVLRHLEDKKQTLELRARYERKIAELQSWRVPAKLEGVRSFALEQLHDSLRFDCMPALEVKLYTPEEWLEANLEAETRMLAHYRSQLEREREVHEEINEYRTLLVKALDRFEQEG